jgi:SAGA-associated factor 29
LVASRVTHPIHSQSIPSDVIVVGSQVAYKPKIKGVEGDWIQCNVLKVTGEGLKARYEIQDPEPDDNGNPGQ